MDNITEAIERLKRGIIEIAKELDIDPTITKAYIETLSKDELIDKFMELKELRLMKENARLIELLLI